jgi:peptidyl-prolyl cis-trans isomerase D
MISFFRRLIGSKVGLVVVFIFLGVIAFAFVTADLSNTGLGGGSGATGGTVARAGDVKIESIDLSQRVQRQFDSIRAEQPTLTLADFIAEGGVDNVLERVIDGIALAEFGREQGMVISRRMEDGQIASIPSFIGLNGQFDRSIFDRFLQTNRISEAQFRADLARDAIANQMILPVSGAVRAPVRLITPYASMLLEGRSGRLAFVPTAIADMPAPTDAEIKTYYDRNVQRYTIPERRSVRYALVSRDRFVAAAQPTEAEIAKAYQDNRATYAGRENRRLTQVIVADEAAAKRIASAAAAGTTLEQAAQAAGLEATALDPQSRDAFAELSSPAVAEAAFAAARGTVAPPRRSGLGWHVVRVDAIETVAGKSLDQARAEIAATLGQQKADAALADFLATVENDIAGGATFDEVMTSRQLQPVTTRPLLGDGRDPDAPTAPVAPEIAAVVEAVSLSEMDDDPAVAQIVPNQVFAIVDLAGITPAAPPPLAAIRDRVAQDVRTDRAMAATRRIANAVADKVNGGMPLAEALAGSGARLPAPQTIGGTRQEIVQSGQRVPPPLALLFSMVEKRARVLEAPGKTGWQIVYLDSIQRGDATARPDVIASTRAQFAPVLGQEYVEQFTAAARAAVGVERNDATVARLKRDLTGAQ